MSHGADRTWGRVADTAGFCPKQVVYIPVVVGPLHPGCSHPGHPKVQTWYRPPGRRRLNTVQEKIRLTSRCPLMDLHLTKGSGKCHWTVKRGELRVWEDLLGTSGSKGQGRDAVAAAIWMKGVSKKRLCRGTQEARGVQRFSHTLSGSARTALDP